MYKKLIKNKKRKEKKKTFKTRWIEKKKFTVIIEKEIERERT